MGILIAQVEPGGLVMLAGVVILCLVTTRMYLRRSSKSRNSPEAHTREQMARMKEQQVIKGDMEELLVNLQELTRQMHAQVDTKFAKLEASIRAADERIEKLERLGRGIDGQPTLDTIVGDDPPPGSQPIETSEVRSQAPAATQTKDAQNTQIYELADAGRTSVQIARETGLSTGEVELILALRSGSGSTSK